MHNEKDLFVKMVLDYWFTQQKRTTDLFNELTDEQLEQETSPGRNRGLYLLGHLAAVHDRMIPLLGFGEQLYPKLTDLFVSKPDHASVDLPSIGELRSHWNEVNEQLTRKMMSLSAEEWFTRHTAVSEEDFANEPHRNKLNLIINRTNHLSSHYGQLLYLRPKKEE